MFREVRSECETFATYKAFEWLFGTGDGFHVYKIMISMNYVITVIIINTTTTTTATTTITIITIIFC